MVFPGFQFPQGEKFGRTPTKSRFLLTLIFLKIYWKSIFAVLWVILLLPIPLINNSTETRCAYVVLVMAGYWVTECLPMSVTSLIPVVFFPTLGILDTKDTCGCYMNDTIMVFIGGLVLALAIEHSNLHMRIALGVMKALGCSHRKLLGGISVCTTFISMWVSNTAATAMMLPIISAILQELEREGLGTMFNVVPDPRDPTLEPEERPTKVTKAYFLLTAYSATFGGIGTIVGTGTNLTFKGIFETTFPEAGDLIGFTPWMLMGIPMMIVNSSLTWLYIQVFYLGLFRPNSKDAKEASIGREGEEVANKVIEEKFKNLGRLTFHELSVAILFGTCVLLWVFRAPGFMMGWAELITDTQIRDSTPVILITLLMFYIPKEPRFLHSWSKDPAKRPIKSSEGLVTWKVIHAKMPWALMLLLGGGFAISRGSNQSCLSKRVGESMSGLKHFPRLASLAMTCFLVGTITELTSNVGIANIVLPVVAQLCVAMEMNPIYLMIPATITCSYSFRLPVGTPPNAIIAMTGKLHTSELITGGCIPSIYSHITTIILFPTLGNYIFGADEYPQWARDLKTSDAYAHCN